MSTDPKRKLFTAEVACLLTISQWQAREWLKLNGKREGKGYFIRLVDLLRHRDDLRDDGALVEERLTLASDFKQLLYRQQRLELRLSKLESADRKRRKRRRRMAQRLATQNRRARQRNHSTKSDAVATS